MPEDVDALFALADLGVRAGLAGQGPPSVDPETLPPALREPLGVFVTLEVAGELNGCIGSIVPEKPLGAAVPELAWRSAFADPRLPVLTAADYPSLEIKLSLIGPLEPVPAESEDELAAGLRPGVDGVLIRGGSANATFLPAVWKKLPDPLSFLRHLQAKAGLRPGEWPAGMQAWRYETVDHRRRALDIDSRSAA
ncbi:MAG: AmmeMemoRadiSam system protein A [Actinomycetota bacterium]|nr:AmmeMemoRadiSam system protein A [Actinomycetota bacterium]